MNRQDDFHRLHFDYDRVLNDQIDAITLVELDALVRQRNGDFAAEADFAWRELLPEASHVSRLEKTGTECSMNVDRGAYDLAGRLIVGSLDQHRRVKSKARARADS